MAVPLGEMRGILDPDGNEVNQIKNQNPDSSSKLRLAIRKIGINMCTRESGFIARTSSELSSGLEVEQTESP